MTSETAVQTESPKASEAQFNAWSRDITEEDYDVRWITSQLVPDPTLRVLDVGGGNGRFASIVANWGQCRVQVIDPSQIAAENFTDSSLCSLITGDFNTWNNGEARYDLIIFRVVLHHLIGQRESDTLRTQQAALSKACSMLSERGRVYILENIYDPVVGTDLSARLIYEATRLQGPANLFRRLGANTAGEGVRFHSLNAWRSLLSGSGLSVETETFDYQWANPFPLWQRAPFLCSKRYQWLSLSRPVRR